MKRSSLAIVIGSLCAVSTALATTYVRVEKDGTKTYSDRPLAGGQPLEVQPAQTYSAPAARLPAPSNLPREQQLLQQYEDFKYQSCRVTPDNDVTFANPEKVTIAVIVEPSLRSSDVITLIVDGQPVGAPNTSSYNMSPVYRGTHTVAVTVKNTLGQVLCNSTSSFHVLRPTLNSPGRR
jgi:hypothetical protein